MTSVGLPREMTAAPSGGFLPDWVPLPLAGLNVVLWKLAEEYSVSDSDFTKPLSKGARQV